ncbi:MAG TPA: M56 family metallopeptidase [Gemmatimonas sp.]|uniref:M56 family metallopeptidase n=1 Tax=Gemmatimonas sp. TaxID=1962908 RepID=UPI002ED90908
MSETSPDLPLMVMGLQELAIWVVAAMVTLTLSRRPDLERLPLRLALALSLLAGALLAFGWTLPTGPSLVTRLAVQTPPAMQAMLEEDRTWAGLEWARAIWAVVAAGLVVRLVVQCVRSWRVAQRAVPITALPPEVAGGYNWWPSIRRSDTLAAPATIGNVIVLPHNWSELHTRAIRALLQHERGHVSRGDFWWTLLSKLHLAVFWWNPLAWWADRRLAYLAECLSDDDALSSGHRGTDYAELLLQYVQRTSPATVGLSAARCMHQRLDRILTRSAEWQRPSASRSTMAGLLTGAALVLCMPVLWAAGAATEFSEPLRFVLVRGGGKDVLMSGSQQDAYHALAAAGQSRQSVLWYARGSRVRMVDDACVIAEVEAFHRGQRATEVTTVATAASAQRLTRTEPARKTFWLIRKIDRP